MKKAFPAALVVLVLLVATACGGQKLTKTEQKISKSIATAISKPDGALLSKKDATCVADKFVASLGEKKLKSAKVVGADDTYNDNGANVDKKTSQAYSKALLGCVDEKKALAAYQASVTKAISTSASNQLSKDDISCFAGKFVRSAGIKRLLSSQVITDAGELNTATASMDEGTASAYADALLSCVDYRKSLASQAAASDKTIDATKLEACFKKNISDSDIRGVLVANQIQSTDAPALTTAITKKSDACAKASKKAKK